MAQKTFTSAMLTSADVNTFLAGEGGAWQSWSPVVTQGVGVSVTNTRSRFARYSRTIHYVLSLAVTSAGTSGSQVTVSVPVTAAASDLICGSGYITDTGFGNYQGNATLLTTTTIGLVPTWLFNASGVIGQAAGGGAFALASGDFIYIAGTYEAAS